VPKMQAGMGVHGLVWGIFSIPKRVKFVHSAGMILTPNFSDLAYRYAFFLMEIIIP